MFVLVSTQTPPVRPLLPPTRKTSSYIAEYLGTILIPVFFVGMIVAIRYTFAGPDWECSGSGCLEEFDRLRGWTFPVPLFAMMFVCPFGFAAAIMLRAWGRRGRPPSFEPKTPSARPALKGVARSLLFVGLLELGLAAGFALAGLGFVAWILGAVGLVLVISARGTAARAARSDRILQTGVSAIGEITGVERTGSSLNDAPLLRLTITIHQDGVPLFPVVHEEYIPQHYLGRVQVGARLPVKVDPLDSSSIVIEWHRQLTEG